MKKEYVPITNNEKLGYVVEELGELQSAIGKSLRWGFDSYNPELPEKKQERNRTWVEREIKDVRRALRYLQEVLDSN